MSKRAYIAGILTGLALGGVGIGTAAATGRTLWLNTGQYAYYPSAGVICHAISAQAIYSNSPGMFCTASPGGWDAFISRTGITAMRRGHDLGDYGNP